jgi:hypothetical protein
MHLTANFGSIRRTRTTVRTCGCSWVGRSGRGIGDISRTQISEAKQDREAIRFAKIADNVARQVIEQHTRARTH